MKHLLICIGLAAGLLSVTVSCTTNNSGNTQTVSQTTDSTSIGLAEAAPIQSTESVDSLKKDTSRHERKGPFIENDTTFLYRFATVDHGYYYFEDAYIERDRQSESYQRMLKQASTFLLDKWDKEDFAAGLKYLKETYAQPFPKHTLSDNLPRTWIPIRSFQGKYCISELTACYPSFFTDSLYIRRDMDGLNLSIIKSFKQISPTQYHFDLIRGDNPSYLDLQIIDTERKIAVITINNPAEDRKWHTLCIAKETAPLLEAVCWNSTDMPEENNVDFDEIDFETLLKQQK